MKNQKRITLLLAFLMLVSYITFAIIYDRYNLNWQIKEMKRHAIVVEEDFWALDTQGSVKYLSFVAQRDNYASISILGLRDDVFLQVHGPSLNRFDLFFENIGLIRSITIYGEIKHKNEAIGRLVADYRNNNIYTYFYVLAFSFLFYSLIILMYKTIFAKHLLEERVQERTVELEEEIDDRIRIEAQLNDARYYISSIIDSMPSIIVGVDSKCIVTQWNKTAENKTGMIASLAKGMPLNDVLPQMNGKMHHIEESIKSKVIRGERKIPRISGSMIYFDDLTIYPLIAEGFKGAVIRVDDVTEKVRLEELMIQSEKMLSVGGLAAGMAHEINNPLGGMMQTANVMKNRLGKSLSIEANRNAAEEAGTTMEVIKKYMDSRGIPRMLDSINKSGQRVAEIIENMLSFSKKSDGKMSMNSLEILIEKSIELASNDYNLYENYDFKTVTINRKFDGNLPFICCDSSKIQQVLLNILRNGAQAMEEANIIKPEFNIMTRMDNLREMVCIEIEDNGPGIIESKRKRVFEPFFTTKAVGLGTGLGLSVSYFIITENHQGEMEVESDPGSGARFILRLPIDKKLPL